MSLAAVHYLSMIGGGRLDDITSTGIVGDEVTLSVNSLEPTSDYGFDWGDETTTWATADESAVVESSHTYTEEGTYTVRVFEDFGGGRTVFRHQVVQAQKADGMIALLDAGVEENSSAEFGISGLSPNTDLVVVWGDGSTDSFTSNSAGETSGPHTYDSYGDYVIQVIDDEDDPEDPQIVLASLEITVEHREGGLDWDDSPVTENEENTLLGTDFAFSREYTVNWGDEASEVVETDGTGALSVTHTYDLADDYVVTVSDGEFTAATLNVTVEHRAGDLAWDDSPVVEAVENTLLGTSFAFDREYTVVWGDSSSNSVVETDGTGAFSANHTYASAGAYVVTASDGAFTAATLNVTVDSPPSPPG